MVEGKDFENTDLALVLPVLLPVSVTLGRPLCFLSLGFLISKVELPRGSDMRINLLCGCQRLTALNLQNGSFMWLCISVRHENAFVRGRDLMDS